MFENSLIIAIMLLSSAYLYRKTLGPKPGSKRSCGSGCECPVAPATGETPLQMR